MAFKMGALIKGLGLGNDKTIKDKNKVISRKGKQHVKVYNFRRRILKDMGLMELKERSLIKRQDT